MIECVTHNFFSSQNCISIMLPKGSMVYQKESSLGNILTFSLTMHHLNFLSLHFLIYNITLMMYYSD